MIKLAAIVVGLVLLVGVPFFFWGDLLKHMFAGDGAVRWLSEHGAFAWLAAIGLLIADLGNLGAFTGFSPKKPVHL